MLELARPEDRETLNRIKCQAHAIHVEWRPDIYQMSEALFDEEWYAESLRHREIYAAKLHGVIVGYVRIRIMEVNTPGCVKRKMLLLDDLGVEESCRGQGIGSAMMEDVHALAKAFGCTDMQLSVYPQNDAALALYRKFGFTIRNINMQRKV